MPENDTSPSAIYSSEYPGGFANQSLQVLNHWQKPGDKARFARYTTQGDQTDNDFTVSDAVYSDASYIRLQNVSISYDLPAQSDTVRPAPDVLSPRS